MVGKVWKFRRGYLNSVGFDFWVVEIMVSICVYLGWDHYCCGCGYHLRSLSWVLVSICNFVVYLAEFEVFWFFNEAYLIQ